MEIKTINVRSGNQAEKCRPIVSEKLFRLTVNGRELLVLVSSPHQPEQLITGFLYLQGLITAVSDIVSFDARLDSGLIEVMIRGDLPERLKPTLTSGCGGGVVFDDLGASLQSTGKKNNAVFTPDFIIEVMAELFEKAKQYSAHGGIHSAAICDSSGLLLHAEDLGRHNTIDRIAGATLLQEVDPTGKLLLSSGRVSSEMAVKASRLGIAAIASRTSPTDLAVNVCEYSHIGLAGYVRGGSMEIYANNECFGF